MGPESLLHKRFKASRNIRFSSCTGIHPSSLFEERSNDSRAVKFPNDNEIFPIRLLWERLSTMSDLKFPRISGMLPPLVAGGKTKRDPRSMLFWRSRVEIFFHECCSIDVKKSWERFKLSQTLHPFRLRSENLTAGFIFWKGPVMPNSPGFPEKSGIYLYCKKRKLLVKVLAWYSWHSCWN